MTDTKTLDRAAGLIFQQHQRLDIITIGDRLRTTFKSLDQSVTGVHILSDDRIRITARFHELTAHVFRGHTVDGLDAPAPVYLELKITPTREPLDTTPHPDTILAHALKSLHLVLPVDQVKWVKPGLILTSAEFALATDQAAAPPPPQATISRDEPGIIERRYTFPSIDETHEHLHEHLSQNALLPFEPEKHSKLRVALMAEIGTISEADDDEEIREDTAPLRLSVWMVSFTVALFSLPVGAALLVFNLLKGENLRLSAQAAALTGTFITLDAHGATAETLAMFQTLIG